ncbi:MAG: mca 1 [Chitinophagaceae bacterium]|nr:mca 1 [Chitinophagaceae bacterium]
MEKKERRTFLKQTAIGIAGIAAIPFAGKANESLSFNAGTENKLNVLCVGAHPGDPEFGCGGTLAKYSEAGHNVTILYLTRGEAGDPAKSFAESASLRTKEAEVACRALNAKPLFAGQIDGNTELNKVRNEEMTKLILAQKPDIVFTQWPVDSHIDHQVAGLLSLTAWVRSNQQFHLYYYEVNTGSETMGFEPTDYVDISNVREKKKAAMFAHQTQRPQETYDDFFKAMEEFRGLEAGVKAAEAFVHFKAKAGRATIVGL